MPIYKLIGYTYDMLKCIMLQKLTTLSLSLSPLPIQNRSRGQLLHEFSANFKEYTMACKQGRATRKVSKRSNWLPIGASRSVLLLARPFPLSCFIMLSLYGRLSIIKHERGKECCDIHDIVYRSQFILSPELVYTVVNF